ncbi:MAG: hypothetical protein COB67_13060 [SAR324 cluster bacterium]|uniref:Glycosyltransferase RgtA/B/C/D-like domain-containing protein n=1 Tax=SAR324 cluster bacterium TaxID=2024889 RepID=A0A2A4SPT5_9DELT|nr:MAG: hypothetical protein COB67_13060 [SAR324 cluster bacterium]
MNLVTQHKKLSLLLFFSFLIHSIVAIFPPLQGDEAYFWEWSRHLSLGYYSHPPMTGWLIALITKILPTATFTIRLTSIILHLVTTVAVYSLAWGISRREKFSLVAAVIYATMPLSLVFGTAITTDSSLICFFALTTYFMQKAVIEQDKKSWYWGAVACGGMLLSKFMAILFFPAIFLFLLVNRPYRKVLLSKEPYLAFLLALVIFSPFLYWNAQNEWLTFQFNFVVRHQKFEFELMKFVSFVAGQMAAISPLFFISLFLFFFKQFLPLTRKIHREEIVPKSEAKILFLSYIVGFPLLYFLFMSFNVRVGAHWLAVIFPAASVLIASWFFNRTSVLQFDKIQRPKMFKTSMGITLAIFIPVIIIIIAPKLVMPQKMLYTEKVGADQPILSHYYGWRAVGEHLEKLNQEWSQKPEGFFFTTRDYSIASMLGFYTPSHPQFYLINFPKDGIHGKDFLIWAQGKKKLGANTIYVADTSDSYAGRITPYFKEIKQLAPFVYRDEQGRILRIFYLTLGLDYQGGEPNNLSVF